MSELTSFELAVVQKLLDGEGEVLSTLREQVKGITVTKREMTGVGFYTTFSVSDGARRLPDNASFKFGDVTAKILGLNHGAGFLLYVQDGALHMLEAYTYDESWPEREVTFELSYVATLRSDISTIIGKPEKSGR
jgi:hypothetical protein